MTASPPADPRTDPLWQAIRSTLADIPADFGGGCPVSKAYVLAWLIRAEGIRTTLDIGVYRGRSFFPQALAHRDHTGGVVYGVDPFSRSEAMQHDHEELRERIREFVTTLDYEGVFRAVLQKREALGLAAHCTLVRETSAEAAAGFAARGTTFGLVHVDGNHDTAKVLSDVELYRPLLGPRAFLILDDISWPSVKPAVGRVAARASLLYACSRPDTGNDYAVFWTGRSPEEERGLRESVTRVADAAQTFL